MHELLKLRVEYSTPEGTEPVTFFLSPAPATQLRMLGLTHEALVGAAQLDELYAAFVYVHRSLTLVVAKYWWGCHQPPSARGFFALLQ